MFVLIVIQNALKVPRPAPNAQFAAHFADTGFFQLRGKGCQSVGIQSRIAATGQHQITLDNPVGHPACRPKTRFKTVSWPQSLQRIKRGHRFGHAGWGQSRAASVAFQCLTAAHIDNAIRHVAAKLR